jgi:hypothetical protein
MLSQFLVHERARHQLGWIGGDQRDHLWRQVLAQKCIGGLLIAEDPLEESIVNVSKLRGHDSQIQPGTTPRGKRVFLAKAPNNVHTSGDLLGLLSTAIPP